MLQSNAELSNLVRSESEEARRPRQPPNYASCARLPSQDPSEPPSEPNQLSEAYYDSESAPLLVVPGPEDVDLVARRWAKWKKPFGIFIGDQ